MCADLLPCVYSIMEPQRQQLMVNNRKYQADGGEAEGGHGDVRRWADVNTSAVKYPSVPQPVLQSRRMPLLVESGYYRF